MFGKGYLNKLKHKEDEAEAYEELERDLKAMREEETEEKVEPVNEAYRVDEVGSVSVRATMDLLRMCNKDIYDKIQRIEPVDDNEIPDYIYKDLCMEIGRRMLKKCTIKYRYNAVEDEVIFVAVKK